MSLPFTFEDTLRKHDVAIHNWLRTLTVNYDDIAGTPRNGVPILAIQSTPERAFATIPDLLVSRGWISGSNAEEMRTNSADNYDVLPLPLCTVLRGEPQVDYEQSGPPKAYGNRFIDPATQKWVKHRWPGSYRLDYTLTFWCRKRYTEAYIREWFLAQLGEVGAGPSEFFIPVQHDAPWGAIPQSVKFLGSSDLTELEGEEQRHIRFEIQLSLRMMLMFKPILPAADEGYPVTSFQLGVCQTPAGRYPNEEIPLGPLHGGFQQSDNLFAYILPSNYFAQYWPKTGMATGAPSEIGPAGIPDGLRATVTLGSDSVELAERPVQLDGQGQAVVHVSFAYLASAATAVEVTQRDPATEILTAARTVQLPGTAGKWKRVSFYALVAKPIFAVSLVGVGSAAAINVAEIDIRHIFTQGLVSFTSQTTVGVDTEYHWTGLPRVPLLVRATLGTTASPSAFVLRNDALSPTQTNTVLIDDGENVGFVALVEPRGSTVVLLVPPLVALVSVALHRYGGHYHPNEV